MNQERYLPLNEDGEIEGDHKIKKISLYEQTIGGNHAA